MKNSLGILSAIPVLIFAGAANGQIVLEQTVTGGHAEASPVTLPSIQAGTAQTYVLVITTGGNADVTAVSGGGLSWAEQKEQCGTENVTGTRIWTAQGSPPSSFQVQISYVDDQGDSLTAVLSRYSGVGLIIDPTGENVAGENDSTCSGGTTSTAQLTLTSTYSNSVHVIGIAPWDQTVSSVSAGYTLAGSDVFGENRAYMYQKAFGAATQDQFQATLSDQIEWSTAGIVLSPPQTSTSRVIRLGPPPTMNSGRSRI